MSEMNESIFAEDFNKGFREAVKKTPNYSDAKNNWDKWPFTAKIPLDTMLNEVSKDLFDRITNGIVQLTFQEITENQIKMKISLLKTKLPCVRIYVEFIIKSGTLDIYKFSCEFFVNPSIEIKDFEIKMSYSDIENISFGSFDISGDIFILRGGKYINIINVGPKPIDLSKVKSKIKLNYK